MEYRVLGTTDIEVSTIAFGCWPIIGGFTWGDQDHADSIAALRAAYDEGITFYDTAEAYGKGASEQLIAEALGEQRDNIAIASKVSPGHLAADDLRAACERSLQHLKTDYIDLYQIHWPSREVPLEDTLATLAELVEEGKVRACGVSNFGPRDLAECLSGDLPIVTNQVAYNLVFRAIEYEVQPVCVESGVSILPYSPLAQGLLLGKFAKADEVPVDRARTRHFASTRDEARHSEAGCEELLFEAIAEFLTIARAGGYSPAEAAIGWLLGQEAVPSVLVGARNAEQARQNAACGDLVMDRETRDALSDAGDALKRELGLNADMWQSESRIR